MKRPIGKTLLAVAIALTLCWIWGNSMLPRNRSGAISSKAEHEVFPAVESIVGTEKAEQWDIRKAAHLVEFALLAGEALLLAGCYGKLRPQTIVNVLAFGLLSAVIDESIQILSDRGAQVSDILLDLCGYASGLLIAAILRRFVRAMRAGSSG